MDEEKNITEIIDAQENTAESNEVNFILCGTENTTQEVKMEKTAEGTADDTANGGSGESYYYPWQTEKLSDSVKHAQTESFYEADRDDPRFQKRRKNSRMAWVMRFVAIAACFGVIVAATYTGTTMGLNALKYSISEKKIEVAAQDSVFEAEDTNAAEVNVAKNIISTTKTVDTTEMSYSPAVSVVEKNMPATVMISCMVTQTYSYFGRLYSEDASTGGTGIIVGSNDREFLIATNSHVVADANKIMVTFSDGNSYEANIKGKDSVADLAIIAVSYEELTEDTKSVIAIAELGDSSDVKLGEMVVAIGNALGCGQSVTVGYISAKDREVTISGNEMILLQTDAAINSGNSGGGLFNAEGKVIGITSAKYSDTTVEGMCFAIPISRAIPILEELMARETLTDDERGYLGIQIQTVTDSYVNYYGMPYGVYVYAAYEGGAAEKAGIYAGDVITAVGNIKVKTSEDLQSAVGSYRAGSTISFTIQRQEKGEWKEYIVDVVLQTYDEAFSSQNKQNE